MNWTRDRFFHDAGVIRNPSGLTQKGLEVGLLAFPRNVYFMLAL